MASFIKILNSADYISNPTDFFYTYSEESLPLVEGLKLIFIHNHNIIKDLKAENESLAKKLDITTIYPEKPSIESKPIEKKQSTYEDNKEVLSIIELLNNITDLDTITKIIDDADQSYLPYIKLYYYQKILILKKELIKKLSINPLTNIKDIQSQIEEYSLIIDYINSEEVIEQQEQTISNIILLPNNNTSYLNEDIQEYLNNAKEIKNALDKITNSYFGKDVKSIKKYSNLYEYTHPNGIRILYVLLPNNRIGLSLLFYKDKNKSIKIDKYYEEALSRYNKNKQYILDNLDNPDFYIEQATLLGELYTVLESRIPLTLKKEDE